MKKLLKKIKSKIRVFKINNKIKKYKFVHLMFNDKFNKPFVDFLNRSFNPKEHLILCKRFFNEFPFPEGENVIEIKSLKGLKFDSVKKIICHSLFDNELVDYLYTHKEILKNKAYWVIWGGDLYEAPRDEKNDYVRKNFCGYLNDVDKHFAIKKYGMQGKFYPMFYSFPISKKTLDDTKKQQKEYLQIQINNSCDKSTIEMLETLSKFKDENVMITTVLSYGNIRYKQEIIQKGKEIFADKFNYLDTTLSPKEYAQQLATNDILILNQDRQQGFGNILASLYLGAKVYIKSAISTYKYFNEIGIRVFSTEDISNVSFEALCAHNEIYSNKKLVSKFFSNDFLMETIKDVFK